MKLGYMNSRRPSKPNLPSVPKPSKFFALTRLRRTFVFFSLPDSAITHNINQCELVPSQLLPKAPKNLLTDMGMVRKVLANKSFKVVIMERVRVKEFEKSLCKDWG